MPATCPPRREKVFGSGRPLPLDREAKHRIMTRARALSHRTAKGRAYGVVTAKAIDVLEALLWTFHNAKTGLCFPSLDRIAEAAGCARSTVAEAIKALEAAGLLSWVNRLKRVRETVAGLFGEAAARIRVMRTSNGYRLHDPKPARRPEISAKCSKSENPTRTTTQDIFLPNSEPQAPPSSLEMALQRLGAAVTGKVPS
jgi:DNA-binding MarR family transcriptional regulator